METNNINIGFESLKDKTIKEINQIEQQLKNLKLERENSTNKDFVISSNQYEEILNEELRKIKEKGLYNNRQVRKLNKIPYAERLISDLK